MTLLVNHHSVPGDWNFSAAHWALDTSVFVSPPSSLRFNTATATQVCTIKASVSGIVKAGQLVTQHRRNAHMNFGFVFRAQGPASARSCYLCFFESHGPYWALCYIDAAGNSHSITGAGWEQLAFNTWHKHRLTFWEAYNYQNIVSLAVRLEAFRDNVWTTLITWYDPNNHYAGSSTNLVGLWKRSDVALQYYDDTELWVPAS